MTSKGAQQLDTTWPLGNEQSAEVRAQAEHLRLVVNRGVYVFLGNLAASLTLVVGTWDRIPSPWLLGWFAAITLFGAARWVIGRRFPAGAMAQSEIQAWDRRLIASVFASGCLWGVAGELFFLPGQSAHNFFMAVLIIAMAAAAATSLSYHRLAYPAFFLPAVTPITLNLLLESGTPEMAIGVVSPFYFLLMYLLSRDFYRAAHISILAQIRSAGLAYYDPLTGVPNRRAFEEVLQKEWLRARRYHHPLALAIADIDNFKRHNDTYGHSAGDEVLRAVAQMIEDRTRRGTDLVARIGGEEFAVILPETDVAGAEAFMEGVVAQCRELRFEYGPSVEVLTMSAGVASCVPDGDDGASRLFAQADAALYRAKLEGKNRIAGSARGSD